MHWKIKRDKYYSELIKNHIFSFIEKAGFFYDTDAVDMNIDESVPFYCICFEWDDYVLTRNDESLSKLETVEPIK